MGHREPQEGYFEPLEILVDEVSAFGDKHPDVPVDAGNIDDGVYVAGDRKKGVCVIISRTAGMSFQYTKLHDGKVVDQASLDGTSEDFLREVRNRLTWAFTQAAA